MDATAIERESSWTPEILLYVLSVLYRKTGDLSNAVVAMVLVRIENCWLFEF